MISPASIIINAVMGWTVSPQNMKSPLIQVEGTESIFCHIHNKGPVAFTAYYC